MPACASTCRSWASCARGSTDGGALRLRGRGGDRARLARGPDAGSDAHRLRVGRSPPGAGEPRLGRARALAHQPHAVPAGDHGLSLPALPHRAGGAHEGGPDRGHRARAQLDRLRHPPRPGADDGGLADGGDGQARLQAAHRRAPGGDPRGRRAHRPGPQPRLRQHHPHQGVPGRGAGDDRRQLGGGPALDAGALPLPRRGGRLPLGRRGRGRCHRLGRGQDPDLRAQEAPHRLHPDHRRGEPHRARVHGLRSAPLLRALPALRGAPVAALRAAAVGAGAARGRCLPLRGLRAAHPRAPQGLDAGARGVAPAGARAGWQDRGLSPLEPLQPLGLARLAGHRRGLGCGGARGEQVSARHQDLQEHRARGDLGRGRGSPRVAAPPRAPRGLPDRHRPRGGLAAHRRGRRAEGPDRGLGLGLRAGQGQLARGAPGADGRHRPGRGLAGARRTPRRDLDPRRRR